MEFEWDPDKAKSNLRKHGVDFADAVLILEDDLAITVQEHHHDEERFVTIGTDPEGRVLVLVYTWRGQRIRPISARHAEPREARQYREHR